MEKHKKKKPFKFGQDYKRVLIQACSNEIFKIFTKEIS